MPQQPVLSHRTLVTARFDGVPASSGRPIDAEKLQRLRDAAGGDPHAPPVQTRAWNTALAAAEAFVSRAPASSGHPIDVETYSSALAAGRDDAAGAPDAARDDAGERQGGD